MDIEVMLMMSKAREAMSRKGLLKHTKVVFVDTQRALGILMRGMNGRAVPVF